MTEEKKKKEFEEFKNLSKKFVTPGKFSEKDYSMIFDVYSEWKKEKKKKNQEKKRICGNCKLRIKKICTFWKKIFQHKTKRNDKACDGFQEK